MMEKLDLEAHRQILVSTPKKLRKWDYLITGGNKRCKIPISTFSSETKITNNYHQGKVLSNFTWLILLASKFSLMDPQMTVIAMLHLIVLLVSQLMDVLVKVNVILTLRCLVLKIND